MLTEGNRHSGVVTAWFWARIRYWLDNGFEGSKFLDFAQSVSERRRFRGCGVSLGRLGFAGGLGVMEAASAASWGSDWPISILGVELTQGFHLNGSFWDV